MKDIKNKMKLLRILFPMALFGASYIGYIIYTTTKSKGIGGLQTPTPLMNLIMLAIICISLLLAYNSYKENEGE